VLFRSIIVPLTYPREPLVNTIADRESVSLRELQTWEQSPTNAWRLHEAGVRSLVVERRRPGDEYGIVVVSDIANKVIARNRSPDRVNVYEIMSKPVLTVNADMEVKYAIRLLSRFGLSRGVVIDNNKAVGFVTLMDMVMRFYGLEPAHATASDKVSKKKQ